MGMSAGTGGSGGRKSAMSDINVTPLVDIIFMVTAPLIQQGVKVALPDAKAAPIDAKEKKLVVSIDAAGKVYVGDVEVPYDQLEAKLKANAKAQADKEIYLHADKNLAYGKVVDVMAAAQRAGISNVGMVTDPVSRDAPGTGN
jgi:biopolymer transport protein TolR